jgi:hypothetical protein
MLNWCIPQNRNQSGGPLTSPDGSALVLPALGFGAARLGISSSNSLSPRPLVGIELTKVIRDLNIMDFRDVWF